MPYVMSQADAEPPDRDLLGGKATTLMILAKAGFPVPGFFTVSADAFLEHLDYNGIVWARLLDQSRQEGDLPRVRERIIQADVPGIPAKAIADTYAALRDTTGSRAVAVRSSGGEEDGRSTSYAGQFATYLGVADDAAVIDAVKRCWASYLSDRSIRYRAAHRSDLRATPAIGVIIQRQIFPDAAGVLFTQHPITRDRSTAYIEANFGTGESVVGGLVTPDGYTLAKDTGEILEQRTAVKRRMTVVRDGGGSATVPVEAERASSPVLSAAEARTIARMGAEIESILGGPQDIEWAMARGGLWILQSRPITVSSNGR